MYEFPTPFEKYVTVTTIYRHKNVNLNRRSHMEFMPSWSAQRIESSTKTWLFPLQYAFWIETNQSWEGSRTFDPFQLKALKEICSCQFKVAYYSFSETQLRALRNSLWQHFIFRACNTLRHHREKAENSCEIWLVEIARGLLLTFFIMNGRSLEVVSERYRYKISVKPWKKNTRSCCKNSYVYRTRLIAWF